jgi:hypothetical protein
MLIEGMVLEKKRKQFAGVLRIQSQAGQILLIVILATIIVSTVGLSLISRSITSTRISTEEAESQKALSAAEAGIERAIQDNVPVAVSDPGLIGPTNIPSYNTVVDAVNGANFLLNGGNLISKDEGSDVWFIDHLDDGSINYGITGYPSSTNPTSLKIYWGSRSDKQCADPDGPAAIEAIVVTRDQTYPNEIKSHRYTYDFCNSDRKNNFTSPTAGDFPIADVTGKVTNFMYSTTPANLVSGIPDVILMRVIPLYKNAVIGISATPALPRQGYMITSTGTSGQSNRKIRVFKGWPQTYLPYLSYGLFVAN